MQSHSQLEHLSNIQTKLTTLLGLSITKKSQTKSSKTDRKFEEEISYLISSLNDNRAMSFMSPSESGSNKQTQTFFKNTLSLFEDANNFGLTNKENISILVLLVSKNFQFLQSLPASLISLVIKKEELTTTLSILLHQATRRFNSSSLFTNTIVELQTLLSNITKPKLLKTIANIIEDLSNKLPEECYKNISFFEECLDNDYQQIRCAAVTAVTNILLSQLSQPIDKEDLNESVDLDTVKERTVTYEKCKDLIEQLCVRFMDSIGFVRGRVVSCIGKLFEHGALENLTKPVLSERDVSIEEKTTNFNEKDLSDYERLQSLQSALGLYATLSELASRRIFDKHSIVRRQARITLTKSLRRNPFGPYISSALFAQKIAELEELIKSQKDVFFINKLTLETNFYKKGLEYTTTIKNFNEKLTKLLSLEIVNQNETTSSVILIESTDYFSLARKFKTESSEKCLNIFLQFSQVNLNNLNEKILTKLKEFFFSEFFRSPNNNDEDTKRENEIKMWIVNLSIFSKDLNENQLNFIISIVNHYSIKNNTYQDDLINLIENLLFNDKSPILKEEYPNLNFNLLLSFCLCCYTQISANRDGLEDFLKKCIKHLEDNLIAPNFKHIVYKYIFLIGIIINNQDNQVKMKLVDFDKIKDKEDDGKITNFVKKTDRKNKKNNNVKKAKIAEIDLDKQLLMLIEKFCLKNFPEKVLHSYLPDYLNTLKLCINLVTLISTNPSVYFEKLLKTSFKNTFQQSKQSGQPKESNPEEVGNPREVKGYVNELEVTRFIFLLGHISINFLIFLEKTKKEYRKEKLNELSNKSSNLTNESKFNTRFETLSQISAINSRIAPLTNSTTESLDPSIISALDFEIERHFENVESNLLSEGLLSLLTPFLIHIIHNPNKFQSEVIQSISTTTLCKMMLVSRKFCKQHIKLLISKLESTVYNSIKINIIGALGDLISRFPNEMSNYVSYLFSQLSRTEGKDDIIRVTALNIIVKLALDDMIKVKEAFCDISLLLCDGNNTLKTISKFFFKQINSKGKNLIYNSVPDILNKLTEFIKEEGNKNKDIEVLKFILGFVTKESQIFNLSNKLIKRFYISLIEDNRDYSKIILQCLGLIEFSPNTWKCFMEEENLKGFKLVVKEDIPELKELLEALIAKNMKNVEIKEKVEVFKEKIEKENDDGKEEENEEGNMNPRKKSKRIVIK
eukprot:GAHX01001132.1.p1 GENE.GAHX01001132.1~~GAHX01001132.1.p1  ORF type:complete len:1213 (-),score=251.79 GAHX01001132.1:3728-7312(-)